MTSRASSREFGSSPNIILKSHWMSLRALKFLGQHTPKTPPRCGCNLCAHREVTQVCIPLESSYRTTGRETCSWAYHNISGTWAPPPLKISAGTWACPHTRARAYDTLHVQIEQTVGTDSLVLRTSKLLSKN